MKTTAALLFAMAFWVAPAHAEFSYWDAVTDNAAIVIDTALGNLTARQEKELIGQNWDKWRDYRNKEGQASVGQTAINAVFPVADYTLGGLGQVELLTFFFIDPVTGQPTAPAFTPAAVRYDALLQPQLLDQAALSEELIRANLTTLGTSTDAAANFPLSFVLQGFEPIILAFPLNAQGQEISPPTGDSDFGTAAFVSHVLVPEPSSVLLLSTAMLGLLGHVWYRRDRRTRV